MANTLSNGTVRITHTEEKELPGGWVVLKFGGTSVGKFAESIVEIVRTAKGKTPSAVVCSARSNYTKAEGTTNRWVHDTRG
jgi:aspartate kinase